MSSAIANDTVLMPDVWAIVCEYLKFCSIGECRTQATDNSLFCVCHKKNVNAMRVAMVVVFPPCSCMENNNG
jgi:hypothetical protein